MKRIATFLGLIDDNGQLSRTNVAVYVAIAGMIVTLVHKGEPSYSALAGFIIALVSYQSKRYITSQAEDQSTQAAVASQAAALEEHKLVTKANIEQLISANAQTASAVKNAVQALKARNIL